MKRLSYMVLVCMVVMFSMDVLLFGALGVEYIAWCVCTAIASAIAVRVGGPYVSLVVLTVFIVAGATSMGLPMLWMIMLNTVIACSSNYLLRPLIVEAVREKLS